MSFIDCLVEESKKNKSFNKEKTKDYTKQYNDLVKKYRDAGNLNAESSAFDYISKLAREDYQRSRSRILQTVANKRMKDEIDNMTGEYGGRVSDFLQKTFYRTESVHADILSTIGNLTDTIAPKFGDMARDYNGFNKIVTNLIDGNISSPEVKALKESLDYLHNLYRQNGGVIGYIENYFPMSHSKMAIQKENPEVWKKFILDRLDKNKMIDPATGMPFSEERLSTLIDHARIRIETDGSIDDIIDLKKGSVITNFSGDADTRRSSSRFFIFKDSDSYFEYTIKYGQGINGILPAYLNHIRGMSRDIAMMQRMGPKPKEGMRYLSDLMRVNKVGKNKSGINRAMFHFMRSSGESDAEFGWGWRLFSGTASLLRSAQLGMAPLSALPDTFFVSYTAKINGLSATKTLSRYLKQIGSLNENKKIMQRTGLLAERISGSIISDARFAGDIQGAGSWATKSSAILNEISGLARMTRAAKDSVSIEALATIGENIGKDWLSLDEGLKSGLSRFGMTEDMWNNIKPDIFDFDDFVIADINSLILNGKRKEAYAIYDWIFELRQKASNEGTLFSKTLTSGAIFDAFATSGGGSGKPGTFTRATAQTLFMYKNFLISSVTNHITPLFLKETPNRYGRAASIVSATTLLGIISGWGKDIAKGITPSPLFEDDGSLNYRTITNGFINGGSMGLWSEAVFSERFFGQSKVAKLMLGPMAGLVDQVLDLTVGNFTDKFIDKKENVNFSKEFIDLIDRNIPFGNLWYSGLLFDRYISDFFRGYFDPDYEKRIRRKEKKLYDNNQEFWWRPGDEPDVKKILNNFDNVGDGISSAFKKNNNNDIIRTSSVIIKRFEDFKPSPYLDVAEVPTIGYGTTTYPNGEKVTLSDPPISEEKAAEYLNLHVESDLRNIKKLVKSDLTDKQYSVLLSFVYNFGIGNFSKSKLLKLINNGDIDGAAKEFERWVKVKDKDGNYVVNSGLIKRRKIEHDLFVDQGKINIKDNI